MSDDHTHTAPHFPEVLVRIPRPAPNAAPDPENPNVVMIDGHDITECVKSITIHSQGGQVNEITLVILGKLEVEIEGHVTINQVVELSEEQKNALIAKAKTNKPNQNKKRR